MIVVADSTPLHYLILINSVHILKKLYGRVLVPEAVARELQAHRTPPIVKKWMADPIILDDKNARREAERRKLKVIGTVRILADAGEAGLVELPEALSNLKIAGFYLDPILERFMLNLHAIRKSGKRPE